MRINRYTNLEEAEVDLREKGFDSRFKLVDKDTLYCLNTAQTYTADEVKIVEYHRLDGDTYPLDMAIIFAIMCEDGNQGTIISASGPYADLELSIFMDKVKVLERQAI